MNIKKLEDKIRSLNNKLRILLLQNVKEEYVYDNMLLLEMHKLTAQILKLKQMIRKQRNRSKQSKVSFVNNFIPQN